MLCVTHVNFPHALTHAQFMDQPAETAAVSEAKMDPEGKALDASNAVASSDVTSPASNATAYAPRESGWPSLVEIDLTAFSLPHAQCRSDEPHRS